MNTNYQQMSGSRVFAAYLGDIRFELKKMLRTPAFAVPTLVFPAMFYLLFGVMMGSARGDSQFALHALARYGIFGTMAPGLFGFGVSLAFEREQGLLTLKQALPMPPASYLLARMANAMVFVFISTLLLFAIAVFLGHVHLSLWNAAGLIIVDVLGVLPFCAMGLFVGSLVSGQAAPAIVNLIYLPMAYLAGLWVPLQYLPKMVQDMAPLWPAHHLAQLALASVGAPWTGSAGVHLAALLGVTVLFMCLAMRRLGNRGIHLAGSAQARQGFSVPLRRALTAGLLAASIGLVIAGVMGPSTSHAAATSTGATESEAGSPEAGSASAAPVGVAAPATTDISGFDGGSDAASYGVGWTASDDKMRGGNSSVSQKLADGGAEKTKGALEVSGQIGDAIQYPFAGTTFLPNGSHGVDFIKQGYMDYSTRQTLSFYARGDGRSYLVVFGGPVLSGIPAMYGFTAGPDWQEVRIPLKDLANADLQRIKFISIGSMTPGSFRFEIDGVRIE
jgi:ABC-2 type transport system permease protein